MRKSDLPELARRLAELADALGGRAPSTAGIQVWLDALSPCSLDDVQAALSDWPRKQVKMPAPADIAKACSERQSRRLETRAATQSAEWGEVKGIPSRPNSPIARRELAKIKATLADCHGGTVAGTWVHMAGNTALSPKAWAHKLREREEAGEVLDLTQRRLWREALDVQ